MAKRKLRNEADIWLPGIEEYPELPSFPSPRNSSETFLNLQRRYLLAGRDKETFRAMWAILYDLCGRALTKELKRTGHRMHKADRVDLATDASTDVMTRFDKYEGYHVDYPATIARLAVRHRLYEVPVARTPEEELSAFLISDLKLEVADGNA